MSDLTSRDYINQLVAEGWSYARIGRELGRDGSLVRQIAIGRKPGNNLRAALSELGNSGHVSTPPPRRTSRKGLAKVRAPQGQESVRPLLPRGQQLPRVTRSTEQPKRLKTGAPRGQRNRLRHVERFMPGGRELHQITVPKANSSANRKEGSNILQSVVERAASAGKRISGTVWVQLHGQSERRPVELGGRGGYQAQHARNAISGTPGGGFSWLTNQVENRYPEFTGGYTVVGFDVDVW